MMNSFCIKKIIFALAMTVSLYGCSSNQDEQKNMQTKTATEQSAIQQGKYFAYPFVEVQGAASDAPAGFTKLQNKNGCIGLSDTELSVFPSGVTRWDEQKQALIIRDEEFKIGDWIFSNGYHEMVYDKHKPYEFAQIGQPECLKEGMTLRIIGAMISQPSPKQLNELNERHQASE